MEDWFQRAIANPWPFFSLGIIWVLYKGAVRAFGQDGILVSFLDGIREDSREMKVTLTTISASQNSSIEKLNVSMTQGLKDNRAAVAALERQLVGAIQARPDDNELFDVLFTNNPLPICFVGRDHKFTKINKACDEFFGYSAGELSLMTFEELTVEADIAADVDNVARVAAGSMHRYRMEKNYKTKSGKTKHAALYVFRYPTNGAFLHFISIIVPLKNN